MSAVFIYHKNKYTLTISELELSPYLSTLVNTDIGVDKDKDGNIILDLDVSPSVFQNYINFLKGKSFFLSNQDIDFFDFMGHDNYYEFSAEYWKSMLEGTRHNICGDLSDKITTINVINDLYQITNMFKDIDIYFIGDTALLSAGIVSKVVTLPIVYHIKDRSKILDIIKKKDSTSKVFRFDVILDYKDVNNKNIKRPYKTFKPFLQKDNEIRRINHPDKIWNGSQIPCILYELDFDCIENLLYLLPADTDGIAMHVKKGKVEKTLALVKTYRSYITREVNLIPEYLHHEEYVLRLCQLSLMGFKINVPKFNDTVSYDEYKKNILIERSGTNGFDNGPYSSMVTYLNSKAKSDELRLTVEDYVSLLNIGPTRHSHIKLEIPGKYYKKDVDINEIYPMSQIVHEINMIEYQYMKHEMDNSGYYRIGRIDTYDMKNDNKYIIGHSLLHALKYDNKIEHKFYPTMHEESDILDECYCNISDGIVYASIKLIRVLYEKKHDIETRYSKELLDSLL